MNEQINTGTALKALLEHQAAAKELRDRLAHVSSAEKAYRFALRAHQAEMPNLATLEKAESDAMAAVALGEADQSVADMASSRLIEGRRMAAELGPKIKTAQGTLAGLERKGEEIRTALVELEQQRGAKVKAFLVEEMEAEATRYVKAAEALVGNYDRLRTLGKMAQGAGLSANFAGHGLTLEIGRMEWLKAFDGHQSNSHLPTLMFDGGRGREYQAKRLAAERDERERMALDLGVEFEAPPLPVSEGA